MNLMCYNDQENYKLANEPKRKDNEDTVQVSNCGSLRKNLGRICLER